MARPRGTVKAPEDKFLSKNIRFPPALWAEIERRVPARERSAFIRRAIERELNSHPQPHPSKPLWEQIVDLGDAIPEEERANLPADSSENLDHYLYGAPRKTG
jgi:hypothetical protein